VLTSLISFDGTNGSSPYGGMILGADGNLYGSTPSGGTGNHGAIFRCTTNGLLTTWASFSVTNGDHPNAPLILSTNGLLYGTTSHGGADTSVDGFGNVGSGTVFSVTTNGELTLIASFYRTNGTLPIGGLIKGSDGCLYGVTRAGGASADIFFGYAGYGTVFKVAENGTITTLASFDGIHGAAPSAGLTQGIDGNYYGTTRHGGTSFIPNIWSGSGVIFQIKADGAFNSLASFGRNFGNDGDNGDLPGCSLVLNADGNFYGTTSSGGAAPVGRGTIFRFSFTTAPILQLYSFTNGMVVFTWNSVSNQMYQMQFCADLDQANWNDLGNPIWATNTITTASDSVSELQQRFYRVVLER
jgi:uncharacterized repeat protein (TIGR03803 family)